jgi:hypothetical protein
MNISTFEIVNVVVTLVRNSRKAGSDVNIRSKAGCLIIDHYG